MENKENKSKGNILGYISKVAGYISRVGKANTYKIASALKMSTREITEALGELEKEGKVEISGGVATLARTKKVSEENTEKRLDALEEKQKHAMEKLREVIKILEE